MSLSLPIGILGQVWYLIVSISDLCTLTYFKNINLVTKLKVENFHLQLRFIKTVIDIYFSRHKNLFTLNRLDDSGINPHVYFIQINHYTISILVLLQKSSSLIQNGYS